MIRKALMIAAAAAAAAAGMAVAAAPALAQSAGHHDHGAAHHAHAAFASDRLHVMVEGEGQDVILIPGLSSSPEIWQGTVDRLGGGYRFHRVHVNGFAGAPAGANAEGPVSAPVAEEIARYIAEHGLQSPAVIGHSMGGTIAMMLAARHPDAVGRLMVVDMVPFMGAMFGPPGTTAESVAPTADQVYAAQSGTPREAYLAQAEQTIIGMIQTESERAAPLRHSRDSDQQVSAAAFRELIVTDLRPELPAITAPTEVLYVKFNDPRMTPEITDMIYQMSFQTLPGAELIRVDDAAHFIMLDQPDLFAERVRAFLD
ncbi:MAG: alpha/beta fold hydrolase [Brevundimonas sp.]|uniref:alpha/beta fold hydrolase n=1 Tax=Brevundimonas sp. TaxID=1871086 RepID=UPI003919F6D1